MTRVWGAVCMSIFRLPPVQPQWARRDRRESSPPRPPAPLTMSSRRDVRQKVQLAIAQAFGISASSLYLTKPTFFSRINSTAARTAHDEYWHAHVDKVGLRVAAGHAPGACPRPPQLSSARASKHVLCGMYVTLLFLCVCIFLYFFY